MVQLLELARCDKINRESQKKINSFFPTLPTICIVGGVSIDSAHFTPGKLYIRPGTYAHMRTAPCRWLVYFFYQIQKVSLEFNVECDRSVSCVAPAAAPVWHHTHIECTSAKVCCYRALYPINIRRRLAFNSEQLCVANLHPGTVSP